MQAAWTKRGDVYLSNCLACRFRASALSPDVVTDHILEHVFFKHPGRI
jgi:hypothetical protein